MRFLDKRVNAIKSAYSIEIKDEIVLIKFKENGKTYPFSRKNIELIDGVDQTKKDCPLIVYKFAKKCYKCHKETSIYTYIVFDDGTNDNVIFPWDKERLLENQYLDAHFQDPSIEYYGLKVLGSDKKLDNILMNKFPDKIKRKYSGTLKKSYPMNICECGAKQGWNFVYRQVNEMIARMQAIEIIEENAE